MIIANITDYIGHDVSAEHYYCNYCIVDDVIPKPSYNESNCDSYELKKSITASEAEELNEKDSWNGWRKGMKTGRFKLIKHIHSALLKKFKNQIIVTYYEGKIFKEMLYFKDGTNLGYKFFGEIWSYCPTSVYKHRLPEDLNDVKIKCDDCGKEYKLEEVSYERPWTEGRTLIQFYKEKEMEETCCNDFVLMWNVVL
jgi:hypothetical protein